MHLVFKEFVAVIPKFHILKIFIDEDGSLNFDNIEILDDQNFEHEAFRSYVELYNNQIKTNANNMNESKLKKNNSQNKCEEDALSNNFEYF